MIVVQGKKTVDLSREELLEKVREYGGRVAVDVGTGDGRFVDAYAREHPEWFVIGLDPVAENMAEVSGRALRRRTRLENVLFVMASVEQMPSELEGLAERLFVNLPWGSLMRGLILGDEEILGNLARIAAPGAEFQVLLNLRVFDDPVPIDVQGLPEVTPEYVDETLRAAYQRHGFRITDVRQASPDELLALPTSWAKRLSHRNPPLSIRIDAVYRP